MILEEVAEDAVEPALEITLLLQEPVIDIKQDPINAEYPPPQIALNPEPIMNDIHVFWLGSDEEVSILRITEHLEAIIDELHIPQISCE